MNTNYGSPKNKEKQLQTKQIKDEFCTSLKERNHFLKEYHICCLCGRELTFTHVTNFILLEVKEEAYCSHCNIRNKKEFHKLQ